MKKILLTTAFALVAVSSMTLIPTKADAFPAFARQTGAACLSCHFQTFPALAPFGRDFMFGSFTDVGDQALIEDEHLSIPAVLNLSFDIRGNYTNTSETGSATGGTYEIPQDARLFVAGRVGPNSGAIVVFNPSAPGFAFANAAPTPVWMLLNSMWLNDNVQIGGGIQKSPWGGSNVMEISNVFGHRGDKLGGQDVSAIKAAGFVKLTTSLGVWARLQDIGYIQFALVAPAGLTSGVTNVGSSFGKLVRAVAMLDVGGWDTLIGFGIVTGSAGRGSAPNAGTPSGPLGRPGTPPGGPLESLRVPMDLQFVDVQLQGEVGGMSVGIYGDWAHAKGKTSSTGTANFYGSPGLPPGLGTGFGNPAGPSGKFNTAGSKFDAFSARIEVAPMDRVLLGIGYGYRKFTQATAAPIQGDITTKTLHLAATYKIYQNFDLNITFDNEKTNDPTATLGPAGLTSFTTRTTVVSVETLM